jgi:hypothetical protein
MHRSLPGQVRSIDWYCWAPRQTARPTSSRHPLCSFAARDDSNEDGPRLHSIQEQYEKAPEPKELIILDGTAYAQAVFQTDQGARVMREILRFLSAK